MQTDASDVPLKPGDEVEFVVSHNPRNNKYSATRIKRTAISKETAKDTETDNKRPERLITKLKLANVDKSGKQLVLTRQPNNPADMGKTKSFSRVLKERLPGSLVPLTSNDEIPKADTDNTGSNPMSIMELLMGVQ